MLSIIGPGGVGGVLAAVAKSRSIDVEVVASPRTADIINERGLRLASRQFGEISVPMVGRTAPTPESSVVIATKSYTLPEITGPLAESKPAEVLALCNGISHAAAVHSLPAARITCGSIKIVSERIAAGEIIHYSTFSTIETEDASAGWQVTDMLKSAGIRVDHGGTEMQVLWRKLRFLAPMALLTASTGKTLGPALEGGDGLIAEVAAIASASGLPTEPEEVKESLAKVAPDSSSSLARDVAAGNRTELDALGHDLIRRGQQHGIATPFLERAVDATVRRMAA